MAVTLPHSTVTMTHIQWQHPGDDREPKWATIKEWTNNLLGEGALQVWVLPLLAVMKKCQLLFSRLTAKRTALILLAERRLQVWLPSYSFQIFQEAAFLSSCRLLTWEKGKSPLLNTFSSSKKINRYQKKCSNIHFKDNILQCIAKMYYPLLSNQTGFGCLVVPLSFFPWDQNYLVYATTKTQRERERDKICSSLFHAEIYCKCLGEICDTETLLFLDSWLKVNHRLWRSLTWLLKRGVL